MSIDALPILIQADEVTKPHQPPPPNTTTAVFSASHTYARTLAIGRVVQLQMAVEHALVDDYGEESALVATYEGLITLPIRGPIIGVRRQDEQEVEFMVRNDFPDAQISLAHLRVPRDAERPAREAFARELASRLEQLAAGSKDGDAKPATGELGEDALTAYAGQSSCRARKLVVWSPNTLRTTP